MEAEFLELMPATIQLASVIAVDGRGVVTHGLDVAYPARIELKDELKRLPDGREVLVRGKVFLGTTIVPTTKDRLTLPSGFDQPQPPILDVSNQPDQFGTHHVVLMIG